MSLGVLQRGRGVPGPSASFVRYMLSPLQEFREGAEAGRSRPFWFWFRIREDTKPILPAGPNTA